MDKVDKSLAMPSSSIGFDTEDEVMEYMQQSGNVTQKAGIVFNLDEKANILKITLRFYSTTPWYSDDLWPASRNGIRDPMQSNGGMQPGYYPRGFVLVQNALYKALYEIPTLTISLNRMPIKGYALDPYLSILTALGVPLLLMAFITSFTTTAKVS